MSVLIDDKEFVKTLRRIGVSAKRWRNSGDYTPPADVNYLGELRVHTGGKPELVAVDESFKQAVIRPTFGMYSGESFLVGMDETSNFVCRLPKAVETVAEAHEVLRPEGIGDHAKRQGEWFFTPVNSDLCPTCRRPFESHALVSPGILGKTTHSAERLVACRSATYRVFTYARGVVSDSRVNRHAPLDLGDRWHSAVHNTELSIAQEPSRPGVRDKIRAWD